VSTEAPTPTSVIAADDTGASGSGSNLLWLWIVVGILALAAAGVGLYWYLPKLRQTAREEGYDLEGWLMDDLRKEETEDKEHLHEHDTTTREFDHLPRKSQAILLQDAASQALADYPIQVESIELLRYVLNTEFIVTGRPDGMPGEVRKYVLRVNAPNFHSRAEIASELEWLDAITKETRLSVPVPVKTKKGDWVTTVDHPGLGTWRHCVLFDFLPASAPAEEGITPNRIEFLGALIGLLHKHSAGFDPPPGFIRKHWDLEGIRGEILDVPITQAYADLTSEERQVLKDAQEIVAEATNRLGTGPRVYGLIHGDLHLKSMLFSPSGSPVVIDFDTCGYGYYVYDLAVAVWDIFNRDDFTVLRDALLGGYRKVRPLSDLEETFMIHFVAGRLMIQILTWAPRRTDPNLEAVAEKAIAKQVKQLKALIRILKG
jgi:Ser/Thr protein kinase RdoA (MazF antagonist)